MKINVILSLSLLSFYTCSDAIASKRPLESDTEKNLSQQRNAPSEFESLKLAADNGNTDAQLKIGKIYLNPPPSPGFPQRDLSMSFHYCALAVNQGYLNAFAAFVDWFDASTRVEYGLFTEQNTPLENSSYVCQFVTECIALFPTQDMPPPSLAVINKELLEKDIDDFVVRMKCAQNQHVPMYTGEDDKPKEVPLSVAGPIYGELALFGLDCDHAFKDISDNADTCEFMIRLFHSPYFLDKYKKESKDAPKGFHILKFNDGTLYSSIGKSPAGASYALGQLLKKGRKVMPSVVDTLKKTLLSSKQTLEVMQSKGTNSGIYAAEIQELSDELSTADGILPTITSILERLEGLALFNLLAREGEFKKKYPWLKERKDWNKESEENSDDV